MPSLKTEAWKAIPGYSDYAVSDVGRIKCLRASRGHSVGLIHEQKPDKYGYYRHNLRADDGKYHRVSAHLAVLEAFVGPRPATHYDGSHKNGIRVDCRLENLCWETRSENCLRKLDHGTMPFGENHPTSKLKTEQVIDIRKRAANGEVKARLAEEYRVSRTLITLIVKKKSWTHSAIEE